MANESSGARGDTRIRCACGLSWSDSEWKLLRHVGESRDEDGVLEMRVCACGSTISRMLDEDAPPEE